MRLSFRIRLYRMLVLIVDDEVAIVELLAELLTDEGYQVQTAFD